MRDASMDARRIENRQNNFSIPYLKGIKTDAFCLTLAVVFCLVLSLLLPLMC